MAAAAARDSANWDNPRSAVTSRHILDTAEAHGLDAATILEGTGLTVAQLADPSTEVQAAQEMAIARNLLLHVDDSAGLGIETGLRYNLASTGILGYVFLTSPTVRDAVTIGLRFVALSSAFVDMSLHESTDGLTMELHTGQIPEDVRTFLVERDVAAIAHIAPLLITGDADAAVKIELAATDLPLDLFTATGLAFTVEADARRTAITIPPALLDQPMPAADPTTAAMCVAQCEELLQRRGHRGVLAAQLRTRMLEDPAQMPTMAIVARELSVTERTLHRRLAAEHTSFRALVDEVRETLAVELLQSGLTVEEIARRLGYSETAAFTHAFTRWRGHPPSRLSRR